MWSAARPGRAELSQAGLQQVLDVSSRSISFLPSHSSAGLSRIDGRPALAAPRRSVWQVSSVCRPSRRCTSALDTDRSRAAPSGDM